MHRVTPLVCRHAGAPDERTPFVTDALQPAGFLLGGRQAFGLRSVAMIERRPDGDVVVGSSGQDGSDGDSEIAGVSDRLALRPTGLVPG